MLIYYCSNVALETVRNRKIQVKSSSASYLGISGKLYNYDKVGVHTSKMGIVSNPLQVLDAGMTRSV